jgi:uncharacterized protein (DUF1697 family)
MPRYIALLRGINVGGKNLIPKDALKECFEGLGFEDVATYIQSGNVVFGVASSRGSDLGRRIEEALSSSFGYRATVVLRSRRQMQDIVARAPEGFGKQAGKYRYDVVFLKEPLTAAEALKTFPMNEMVDRVSAGPGALYCARLASKASKSRISRVVLLPTYRSMTIRNWKTTTKLLEMMFAPGSSSGSKNF